MRNFCLDFNKIFDNFDINNAKKKNYMLNRYLYVKYNKIFNNFNYYGENSVIKMKIINYLLNFSIENLYINNSKNELNQELLMIKNNFNNLFRYIIEKKINYCINNLILNDEKINYKSFFDKDSILKFTKYSIEYNNYYILEYIIDIFKLNNYNCIIKDIFEKNTKEGYIFLYKKIHNISSNIIDDLLTNNYYNNNYFNKLLITKKFDAIVFLKSYYKNSDYMDTYLNDNLYKVLFEENQRLFSNHYKIKYQRNYNTECDNIIDKNKLYDKNIILNNFIETLSFLEHIDIKLSFSNFRSYFKFLYIIHKDIKSYINSSYLYIPYPQTKEIKYEIIKYIYNKYKNYFKNPYFYFIDLLEENNYVMIKCFYDMNYKFDEKTYKYILEHKDSIKIILNLLNYNIIIKDTLFCKYYAAKNNIDNIKFLYNKNFLIDNTIMDIAIYNLSNNVIDFLYNELKIKISEDNINLLQNYFHSDNIYKSNLSKYILENYK
jgi:hypothetical protein